MVDSLLGLVEGEAEGKRSLIYFRDRLFKYPFSFTNAFKHLGPIDLSLAALSCSFAYCELWLSHLITHNKSVSNNLSKAAEKDAETWLKRRFGTHLYNIFFADYFRKLWGRSASCLPSSCAAEMIADMFGRREPGMTEVCFQSRSSVTIVLVLACQKIFSEREIYVHSSAVRVSQIKNLILCSPKSSPKSMSQTFEGLDLACIAESNQACLALTYWCDEGDSFWRMADEALVQLAFRELVLLRLMPEDKEKCESILQRGRVSRCGAIACKNSKARRVLAETMG